MTQAATALSKSAVERFVRTHPREAARFVEAQRQSEIRSLVGELSHHAGAALVREMGPETSAKLLEELPEEQFQKFVTAIPVEDIALLVSRTTQKRREHLLSLLPEGIAEDVAELLSFGPNTAGSYMDPHVVVVRSTQNVAAALKKIRILKNERINDVFIIDDDRKLIGRIRVQAIAVAEPEQVIGELNVVPSPSVNGVAPKEEVVELMEKFKLVTIPVVDGQDRVLGAIRHDALMSVVQEDALADLQSMVGVSRDEKALSSAGFAIKKRLPWLGINLLTAFLASFVVGMFEGILAKVTALAVLLPVVAGQSGNTGAQALAVTVRGIALREIRPRHGWQVLRKEGLVGLVNGVAIGLACAFAVYLWSHSVGLGIVIGVSMVLAMVMASLAGAAIPVILTLLGQDPAQSSSIILTTVTDVAGFLSFLGLATLMVSWLL